ncbi:helix-turn-helix domain-containing protein, partial [Patescibacteria group bacterium]|nr:helix-turn-helix domain-containing protein [Patescibacteria group bacterium]
MAEEKVPVEKGEVSPVQMEEIKAGEFYTIQEIANKLRFSEAWITYLVQDGRIKGIKPIGGRWRIPRSEYERLTTQGIPPLPREKIRPAVTEIEVDEKLGGIITEEKPK